MPISPASSPAPDPETIPSPISQAMLIAIPPALELAECDGARLRKKQQATNEGPERRQHRKQHLRPIQLLDGIGDSDLRSLFKDLKI